MDLGATDQILIVFCINQILEKKKLEYKVAVYPLFIHTKKNLFFTYDRGFV